MSRVKLQPFRVIDHQNHELAGFRSLADARHAAHKYSGFIVGPCSICGHDALGDSHSHGPLKCWHCDNNGVAS